ncbi:unnamed protein product [Nippostrongylus brasiliensis]|uniref:Chromo domain-containing protein n=1 Tax=Nippostrongylus brasiliensis TaxID=27835 RepID=A0A0N4YIN9_NIPBR|nr:unnamed protein product [Nippostrongylus brasiliensis]
MSSSRRSLCRRRYDELSDQFFAEIDDICKRCRYRKIAESRDPTPNDLSLSAALSTVTKDHLEYFFCVIRNLVGQPCDDIAEGGDPQPNDLSDVESLPPSDVDHPSSSNSDVVVNAEGKYVYHVKWLGYDTTSDPENFVDEENMNCPELIKEFEREERRKKKERARKLEEQAMLARKKKEEAERRAKAIHSCVLDTVSPSHILTFQFESPDQSSTDNERTSCRVLNLCSSTSCSEDEDDGDPWGGFKYVTRESDAFEKGYKAIKVSVVTEHPVTGAVVGVVVFKEPSNDREFAQYISLRKIQKHAPQELRQYFVRVSSLDEKNIALALLLQTPNKVF